MKIRDEKDLHAVTFDAAGTLIHLAESVGASYSRVARRFDIQADPSALEHAFRAVWKRTPAPFTNTGGNAESPFSNRENDTELEKDWWRRLVHEIFSEIGHENSPHFPDFFEALYDYFEAPGCWNLDPAAHELLTICRESGLRIGLLSNFDYRLRRILTDLGVFHFFDAVVLSGEIQASKPDLRMFRTIQNRLGIPESDTSCILHLGDEFEADIEGANRAGFRSFQVHPAKSPLKSLI